MKEILIGAVGMYIILSIIAIIIDIVKEDKYTGYPIMLLGMLLAPVVGYIANLTYGAYWKHKILTLPNWRHFSFYTLHANNDEEAKKFLFKDKDWLHMKSEYKRLKNQED